MTDQEKIQSIAILVKLTDGTVREVYLSEEDKKAWIKALKKYFVSSSIILFNDLPDNVDIT